MTGITGKLKQFFSGGLRAWNIPELKFGEAHTITQVLTFDFIWFTFGIRPSPKPVPRNCFILDISLSYGFSSPPILGLDIEMSITSKESKQPVSVTRISRFDRSYALEWSKVDPTRIALWARSDEEPLESCQLRVYLDEADMKGTMELSIYACAEGPDDTYDIGKPNKPIKVFLRPE